MPTHYGVDLITFFHPSFWGLSTDEEFERLRNSAPETVWSTIFDALSESGISHIEMTFPPADFTTALQVFGSAEGFRRELDSRNLTLKSGFYGLQGADLDPAAAADAVTPYLEFLAAAGGDTLVVGPPMRATVGSTPPVFADLGLASRVADALHHIGHRSLSLGVKTALHTEAHSIFYTARDIQLMMTLTDPDYVFLCPDTAHITLGDSNPVEVVEPWRNRVVIAHWKDATGPMPADVPIDAGIHTAHREYMCTLGEGVVDWRSWARLMESTGHSDVTLLELDATPDPIGEMIAARTFVESVRAEVLGSSSN
ncbi:sugar phosphate isomerase/epimerase family protein [Subtercola vilae]|nr:sugar phosphate isomerase/epimerase [Subtercola vilae]